MCYVMSKSNSTGQANSHAQRMSMRSGVFVLYVVSYIVMVLHLDKMGREVKLMVAAVGNNCRNCSDGDRHAEYNVVHGYSVEVILCGISR